MRIVADENIPLLDEFFGDWGEIRRVAGRTMSAADVADADLLLVRSVTRVDAQLLSLARPRFVGSATIGTDHVDLDWLARHGIPFAAAPGCNARAVAEYVATVLVLFAERSGSALYGRRLGVVGCGNVGRAVVAMGKALGMDVAVCDPLLAPDALPAGVTALSFDALADWAEVLTLHVPITVAGLAPTHHLVDGEHLANGRWSLLINTSRGAVIDNAALHAWLGADASRIAVLDVWEREPVVPASLLERVWLGTPHIAGYSSEGKWRGTEMVYRAACAALGRRAERSLATVLAAAGDAIQPIPWPGSLGALLATCCPVLADTSRMRAAVGVDACVPAAAFDRLRRDYPERREFGHYVVSGLAGKSLPGSSASFAGQQIKASVHFPETKTPQDAAALLRELGFATDD